MCRNVDCQVEVCISRHLLTSIYETGEPAEPENLIKGKKIQGIGLGNIFGDGPIKLRSTAGKKPGEKPTEAPKVPVQ